MKSAEQIEQSIRKLRVEAGAERREHTLHDLVEAHTRQKEKMQAFSLLSYGRTIMIQKPKRAAAVIAFALLLVGVLSLGTSSVAFSQARRAVSSTLSMLKDLMAGKVSEEPHTTSPGSAEGKGQTTNPNRRKVLCTAKFFAVGEAEQDVWQRLKGQGIEFVEVSADPEVYYATLGPEQAGSFDASITLKCVAAPTVLMWEGQTAAIASTNPETARGLGVGLRPEVSSDGKHIQSTLSFHDGLNGFEIPNVSTEPGEAVLIRTKALFQGMGESPKEVLIRVQVDVQ